MKRNILGDFYYIFYKLERSYETNWRKPIVAFADAKDEKFKDLKKIVSGTHFLPSDFLVDAKTVITYFLPFEIDICESNKDGEMASEKWAKAYIETNELIENINKEMKKIIGKYGYDSTIIPATHNFNKEKLISDWSHRHVAYIAGLGKFGINNMLITEKGCCGRVGSIVTNLKIEPSEFVNEEYCLNKLGYDCNVCVEKCITNSLDNSEFNRHSCYEICLNNAKAFEDSIGYADVCGKCVVNLPCSYRRPK